MAANTWKIKRNIVKIRQDLSNKLELVGQYVEGRAIKEISEMGAVDTGRLRDSIKYSNDKKNLEVQIGSNVEYAPFVELGTENMTARPFLRYSVYKNKDKIKEILSK